VVEIERHRAFHNAAAKFDSAGIDTEVRLLGARALRAPTNKSQCAESRKPCGAPNQGTKSDQGLHTIRVAATRTINASEMTRLHLSGLLAGHR